MINLPLYYMKYPQVIIDNLDSNKKTQLNTNHNTTEWVIRYWLIDWVVNIYFVTKWLNNYRNDKVRKDSINGIDKSVDKSIEKISQKQKRKEQLEKRNEEIRKHNEKYANMKVNAPVTEQQQDNKLMACPICEKYVYYTDFRKKKNMCYHCWRNHNRITPTLKVWVIQTREWLVR